MPSTANSALFAYLRQVSTSFFQLFLTDESILLWDLFKPCWQIFLICKMIFASAPPIKKKLNSWKAIHKSNNLFLLRIQLSYLFFTIFSVIFTAKRIAIFVTSAFIAGALWPNKRLYFMVRNKRPLFMTRKMRQDHIVRSISDHLVLIDQVHFGTLLVQWLWQVW